MLAENNDKIIDIFSETPLDRIAVGTKLTYEQAAFLGKKLEGIITAVEQRRQFVFVKESLQSTIVQFLRILGWDIYIQPAGSESGDTARGKIFDVIARKDGQVLAVEVNDDVAPADLEQMNGHKKSVKMSRKRTQLYLGTDILNYSKLLDGVRGVAIRDLMEREQMGIMLIDKYTLLIFRNFPQLVLEEMPQVLVSRDKVG